MKLTIVTLLTVFLASCSTTNVLVIPAKQAVEIDYNNYQMYNATIKNKSMKGIDVAVLNKISDEQIRGFGLGIKGTETVMVEQENKLVLSNTTNKSLKVKVGITEKTISTTSTKPNTTSKPKTKVSTTPNTYISFTLLNNSAKSIPLIIPNVMNPNLSPFSNSGVSLKIGQEILFREKGKKYVLLVVDNNIKQDDKIDVGKLLKAKRKELGL